jgi:hypothetical protein
VRFFILGFVFCVVCSMAPPAMADDCSDILKGGVFDTIFTGSSSSTQQQLNEWLESVTYDEIKNDIDGNLAIPIDGFPVGANFNKQSFEKYQQDLKEGKVQGFNQQSTQVFIQRNADPSIVATWLECMKLHAPGVHLSATVNPTAPAQIALRGWFQYFDENSHDPTITSFTIIDAAHLVGQNPFAPGTKLTIQGSTASIVRSKIGLCYPGVTFVLNTTNGSDTTAVDNWCDVPSIPPLSVSVFPGPSSLSAQHPEARAQVGVGYKLIGGGAWVHWSEPGNLLTASFPDPDGLTWVARSKDHVYPSPASIQAFAIGLYDPNNQWDVRIFPQPSASAQHPEVDATVDGRYVMTGGGAEVKYAGPGGLLTASYPLSPSVWRARSKDHMVAESHVVVAYAIGIRLLNGSPLPLNTISPILNTISSKTSDVAAHPTVTVPIASGYSLSGGGAMANFSGAGQLLTAMYPLGTSFVAESKDHGISDPASLTAFAIGIRANPSAASQSAEDRSFVDAIDWRGGTYYSNIAHARVLLRQGTKLNPQFLQELRKAVPVAASRVHWNGRHFPRHPVRRGFPKPGIPHQ